MLENPKGSPLTVFFGTVRFFSENKSFSPFQFLMFCDRMDVEKPQRVSPFSFSALLDCFRKFVFSPKDPPFNCDKNADNFGSVPRLARQELALAGPGASLGLFFEYVNIFEKFSIFEYCKREYLTLGSLFAIFEPWIWRRLGPVPACFIKPRKFSKLLLLNLVELHSSVHY